MILAKFGQKLLAVENSAGIALGCIEADFLRFESSGIARRCAQPLPQHHFAILNKSAKIIFAYICLFHNRITFLAFSDRVLFFPPEDLSLSTHDVFRCVCRESGVVLRLARSGGCSIRAGGVGQKAYRLKIQDSKTQKLMTQLIIELMNMNEMTYRMQKTKRHVCTASIQKNYIHNGWPFV